MFIKKVLSFVSSRHFGNNPFISRMFQPLGQNQTFTVHARQMMHMLFETCVREEFQPLGQNQTFTAHARQMMHMLFETWVREELNKLELYVRAAGGKRLKFEDNP